MTERINLGLVCKKFSSTAEEDDLMVNVDGAVFDMNVLSQIINESSNELIIEMHEYLTKIVNEWNELEKKWKI